MLQHPDFTVIVIINNNRCLNGVANAGWYFILGLLDHGAEKFKDKKSVQHFA